ncbi:MAG: HPr kinase/phosphorylase, partial [Oscillospiraceae bacterium]|nr:HPr kinase/phosphorylase [Oscillospiraceae bacterium]
MPRTYSVSLSQLINELTLEAVYMPNDPDLTMITSTQVNRPGVELTGFFEFYDDARLLVFGNTEMAYLNSIDDRRDVID